MPHVETHRRTLDTDHALAIGTLALGIAAVILLAVSYEAAAWTGLVAVVIGAWSQLISRTRPERFENIAGLTAGAVALAVGLARGSLF